jgi:hypothetical protein
MSQIETAEKPNPPKRVWLKIVGDAALLEYLVCQMPRFAILGKGLRIFADFSPDFVRPLAAPAKALAVLAQQPF